MYAAGVIPYTVYNSKVYILLGKEKSNDKWSGFVGNSDPRDKSSFHTAIREFNEETCKIFDAYYINNCLDDYRSFKIDTYKNKKTVVLYFIRFSPGYIDIDLNEQFKSSQKNILYKKEYLEKTELKWFLLQDINNNVLFLKELVELLLKYSEYFK